MRIAALALLGCAISFAALVRNNGKIGAPRPTAQREFPVDDGRRQSADPPVTGGPADSSVFLGCCDASAAIALTDDLFVVANDEDNILRVYSRQRLGRPATTVDLTGFLNPGRKFAEVDIEAAARVGDRIYWISSHGQNAKGKARESRHRFFATSVSVT